MEIVPKTGYLEGQGDLVNRLVMWIIRVTIWVMGLLTYLLSPPDPPSRHCFLKLSLGV